MDRNLDRRVEAVVPVDDPEARARIAEVIEVMLADDRRSWQLGADAVWRRTEEILGRPGATDTHQVLKERALLSGHVATTPHMPHSATGSLDPRA
jgi:polyphosphate kinase